MKIDIITLLRDKNRVCNVINYINSIVKKENYNVTNIFPAIDRNDTTKLEMLKKKYNCTLQGGRAGCALSHMLVMESFLKTNNKYQIIIEDDFKIIKPLPKNNNEIEKLFKEINVKPNNLDILYLNDRVYSDCKHRVNRGCGTEGYILTRHGAAKILKILKNKCDYPIDLKMQGHFRKSFESGWCAYSRSNDINIIINSYKSKTVYVLLQKNRSGNKLKSNIRANSFKYNENIKLSLTSNEVPRDSAYMRLPPSYKINYAWYGDANLKPKSLTNGIEVTQLVKKIYGDGSKDITIHVSNKIFGDPAPKHKKKLYVELSYRWF